MARPKKGTKAGDLATAKWRATMLAKYGSEEGFHKAMQRMGEKGGKASNTGGFAADHDRARVAGAKGGRNSRRGPALRDEKGRAITKDGRLYAKKKKKTVERKIEEPAPQEGFLYRLFRRNK